MANTPAPLMRTGLQALQSMIGLRQRKPLRTGPDGNRRRFPQEIESHPGAYWRSHSNYPFAEEVTIVVESAESVLM